MVAPLLSFTLLHVHGRCVSLWPSMSCPPFLEGYFASEFQVAFHWVIGCAVLSHEAPAVNPSSSAGQHSTRPPPRDHQSSFPAGLSPRYFRSEQLLRWDFRQRLLMVTPHLCLSPWSSAGASIRLGGTEKSPLVWDSPSPLGKTPSNCVSFSSSARVALRRGWTWTPPEILSSPLFYRTNNSSLDSRGEAKKALEKARMCCRARGTSREVQGPSCHGATGVQQVPAQLRWLAGTSTHNTWEA